MKAQKLDLSDLQPAEADLKLGEKTYVLKKFTLRQQIWLKNTFGDQDIKGIFKDQKLDEISQIAFHLLKDASDFQSVEDFQDAIVTTRDKANLIGALLHTIGISQPVIKKLAEEMEQNPQHPNP